MLFALRFHWAVRKLRKYRPEIDCSFEFFQPLSQDNQVRGINVLFPLNKADLPFTQESADSAHQALAENVRECFRFLQPGDVVMVFTINDTIPRHLNKQRLERTRDGWEDSRMFQVYAVSHPAATSRYWPRTEPQQGIESA